MLKSKSVRRHTRRDKRVVCVLLVAYFIISQTFKNYNFRKTLCIYPIFCSIFLNSYDFMFWGISGSNFALYFRMTWYTNEIVK